MIKFSSQILQKVEEDIKLICEDYSEDLHQYERIIKKISTRLSELKEHILKTDFETIEHEILFFKEIKPKIVSKLIYYNTIYKIETKKPTESKAIKKYLNQELKKIKKYFENNLDFYKYYRTNNSSLDNKLFVRGNHDIKLCLDTYYFQSDQTFSTSHDYKVAKIITNDLIQVYLEDQLNNTDKRTKHEITSLNWTGSKVALIELIYGLYAQGVFENGNADIKLIAKVFESTFNIELGDFYHTFMELKSRKINRTKFIDNFRDALIKKMDEQDS